MKILLTQPLKDYKGEILKDEQNKSIELRDIFSIALNAQLKDEVVTAERKNKIFQISLKLYANKEVDFTIDELVLIKEQVGKVYPALIYGRVLEILDKKEEIIDSTV